MTTTKAQADDAYERSEDQRALVMVVEHAEATFDDEIWREDYLSRVRAAVSRVRARLLTVSVAAPASPLAGQLTTDGGGGAREPTKLCDVPERCHACGSAMMAELGTRWTPLRFVDLDAARLQCGECAAIIEVTEDAWFRVMDERAKIKAGDTVKSPVIPEKKGRTRGAGKVDGCLLFVVAAILAITLTVAYSGGRILEQDAADCRRLKLVPVRGYDGRVACVQGAVR